MKGSRWFIISIVAFLLLMFIVEYQLPKKFVWSPTFLHYDEQPFGCAVFDSLMSVSLPGEYSVTKKSLYQLEQEDTINNRGILVVDRYLALRGPDIRAILRMAERGNKIMLAASHYGKLLEDTLKFTSILSLTNFNQFKKQIITQSHKESLYWIGDSTVYPPRKFRFYPMFCDSYLSKYDSLPGKVLAYNMQAHNTLPVDSTSNADYSRPDYSPVALVRPWGKGEIILVTTPLLFTNYSVLDGTNATYALRLMSQMKELPIVRTEAYNKAGATEQRSPFSYLLSQTPLRWGLYLTMIGVLLFMFFTARRRQRAIPVVRDPENKSLEFTELIGTLYYQQGCHGDLVRKKFTYFAEELRRTIQTDVEDTTDDTRMYRRISEKTGIDLLEIESFFREIRPIVINGRPASEEEMKQCIDQMNKIINHL